MVCPKCGAENPAENAFCAVCGTPLRQQEQNIFTTPPGGENAGQTQTTPVYTAAQQIPVQKEQFDYSPITPWGYVGYSLLFAIPIVGIVMMFVFAFGGTQNINLRNYSRGTLLAALIGFVLAVIFGIIAAVIGVTTTNYF